MASNTTGATSDDVNGPAMYGKKVHLEDRATKKEGMPPTMIPQQIKTVEGIKGYDPLSEKGGAQDNKTVYKDVEESLAKDKQGQGEYDYGEKSTGFGR